MWRLYNFLKYLWYGVLFAILIGIFANLLFTDIRPEVWAFLTSQLYLILITISLLAILTYWSWRSFINNTSKKTNLRKQYENYKIIDSDFWEKARKQSDVGNLYLYYVRTDSSFTRLLDVAANDYYIPNERIDREFANKLNAAVKSNPCLIKILSKGGEGKSTFLYHIAKNYNDRFIIVLLEDINNEILMRIEEQLSSLNSNRPLLLLLDNAAIHGDNLVKLGPRIVSGLRKYRLLLVVAERDFRYEKIEDIIDFENNFNSTFQINYSANYLREEIFETLFSILTNDYDIPYAKKEEAKKIYLSDSRKSISECTFAVIDYLKSDVGTNLKFDWEDWDEFTKYNIPELQRLYLILSTFYQFGYNLDINFCANLLDGIDYITINSVISANPNLPIYKRGNRLQLRHETLASWYLDATNERTKRNRENSEYIFEKFLDNVKTPFSRDLFIWLCNKNRDFRTSYLAKHIDDNRRLQILSEYVEYNPTELKCRTELSKIYQYQKKYDEAEKVLLDLLDIEPQDLQARTELSKIYQYQKKYDEAEKVLLEILAIDKMNYYAMAELISVYNITNRPEDCFERLDTFLKNARIENRREPQPMFNNIFKLCLRYHRPDKAREYFNKYSKVLDSRNIELFNSCFGFQK